MAEKVAKLGVTREKDFMYYVKDGAVWKVQRKQPGVPKGKSEKVADGNFQMDTDFIYFVDKDGDVSRAKRAVGGQKRKNAKNGKNAKPKAKATPTRAAAKAPARAAKKPAKAAKKPAKAAKKPAKKAAAKKPAKKVAKKKSKR